MMAGPKLRLHGPQSEIFRAYHPGNTLTMAHGRGLGKSWFVRRLAYLLIAQWEHKTRQKVDDNGRPIDEWIKGVRIVFLLPTFKMFKDIHSRLMEDELTGDWAFLGGVINKTTWEIRFPGGSIIQAFPASAHGSETARGIRADAVFIDECDDIDEPVYNGVVQPWFTEPWSLNIRVFTGTPKRGRHGLLYANYKRGQTGAEIRKGNDTGINDPGLADTLSRFYSNRAWYKHAPIISSQNVAQARATMPISTFKREYEADFDSAEGRVYPFEEDFHVREPPAGVKFTEYLVGGDHGWTDPGVLLLIGILGHGKDAVGWVLEEIYATEKPNSWWNDNAQRIIRGGVRQFYLDPSRPDRIKDFCDLGANAIGADNNIEAGIARVANMLVKHPIEGSDNYYSRLYVHPRCVNTIREFCEYRRKKDPHDEERFLEDVEDKNNHAMDSLRYALVMRFGRLENGKTVVSGR